MSAESLVCEVHTGSFQLNASPNAVLFPRQSIEEATTTATGLLGTRARQRKILRYLFSILLLILIYQQLELLPLLFSIITLKPFPAKDPISLRILR